MREKPDGKCCVIATQQSGNGWALSRGAIRWKWWMVSGYAPFARYNTHTANTHQLFPLQHIHTIQSLIFWFHTHDLICFPCKILTMWLGSDPGNWIGPRWISIFSGRASAKWQLYWFGTSLCLMGVPLLFHTLVEWKASLFMMHSNWIIH